MNTPAIQAAAPAPLYASLFGDIKQRIRQSQTRAMLAVNAELIRLYWDIGRLIEERQDAEKWGVGVTKKLAFDLKNELPDEKGFSERNINRMLSFYREYKDLVILPQAAAKLKISSKVPQLAAQFTPEVLFSIPWMHHAALIEKIKDLKTRHWYMQSIIDFGWSRNVLVMQIETRAHERQGKAVSNFALRLPKHDSDLVQQTLKDPYIFDFLTLAEPFHERELETGLILCLEKFLLELGQGFAFVGRQYHLDIGDQDFYIDLLFYHLKLRCYVVIELKRGKFIPEYALRGYDKPIGISSYELSRALPTELASSLPSIEDIERELEEQIDIKTRKHHGHT